MLASANTSFCTGVLCVLFAVLSVPVVDGVLAFCVGVEMEGRVGSGVSHF